MQGMENSLMSDKKIHFFFFVFLHEILRVAKNLSGLTTNTKDFTEGVEYFSDDYTVWFHFK